MDSVPKEILLIIVEFACKSKCAATFKNMQLACKRWYDATKSKPAKYWMRYFVQKYRNASNGFVYTLPNGQSCCSYGMQHNAWTTRYYTTFYIINDTEGKIISTCEPWP